MSPVTNPQKKNNKLKEKVFSIEELVTQIKDKPRKKPLYMQLIKLVSRKKFDISDQELLKLKILVNSTPNEELDWLVNYAIDNVETRMNNHLELAKYHYKIISLGSNCMSRTIATRWGLKLPKKMGELTHPFDLAVHSYNSVCQLIANDFQDYLNPLLFRKNSNGIPQHKKYNVVFNHERDSYFSENNFSPLIKTYEARIKNFYYDISRSPILFLYFNKPNENILPLELAQIIQQKFLDLNHKFLYINTKELNFDPSQNQLAKNLITHHVPLPYETYNWAKTKEYATKQGKGFEVNIIRKIKQVIIEYFPKMKP